MRTAGRETAFQITLKKQVVRNVKRLLLIKENQVSEVKEFSAFLCMQESWKMQESWLPEIIPLICTSAIWGQYPDTSWVSSGLTAGSGCSPMAARWQVFFSALSFLRAHQLTLEGYNHWWLWHPLFIDMAGNIPFIMYIQPVFLVCLWCPRHWDGHWALGWQWRETWFQPSWS